MDLVASCKDKLAYFRIKELKDLLTQLGLSKQGKKQDLVERILAIFSDEQVSKSWPRKSNMGREEVAKLIDDIHRKMQVSGATDLPSKGQGVLDSSNTKIKELEENFHLDTKVRCLCGSQFERESMIKCEDPRCNVWQHIGCVIIPEKPTEGIPPVPDLFYCELCRLSRADPFWVTVANPLYPVKLTATTIPPDGSNPVQSVEKTFHLSRADKDLLTKQEYDVQAWCMLLNDKVSFRMQWPQYADLQVNGIPIRAINRPGSQLLGANGRDDGPIITPCTKDGINKISLTGCDSRIFCLGVRIVKRRTVAQIINLIPKEGDGERFEDAVARVCRCVGGGTGNENADSDSDLEVVADSFGVNLRCPMSGSRMKLAGRFKPCQHMGCFDLDVFVELNQRSRKWQCPICLKNYSLEHVIIDPYFNRITTKMRHCSDELTEIEVKPDGSWRVKTKTDAERREAGNLTLWHNPDSTLNIPDESAKSKIDMAKEIKLEAGSEGHNGTGLKLGIRKNRNGFWEVSKPEDMNTSSSAMRLQEQFEDREQKVIPMSSSATASARDGEDASVNQDGGGTVDFMNNGIEFDSLSLNVDSAYGFSERNFSAPAGNAEVIVLSDSDDDNDMLTSSGSVYKSNRTEDGGATFSMSHPGIPDVYSEDPALTGGNANLGNGGLLFNSNDDEFGILPWPLSSGNQAGPPFQLFNSDVSDALIDIQHGSINCPTSMNCYPMAQDAIIGSPLVPDSSAGRPTNIDDGLVDNPMAFGGEDPSFQIFLPTRSSDASMQPDLREQADVSTTRTEDWISLRLGGVATDSHRPHGGSIPASDLNSRQEMPSRNGSTDPMADSAALLLGMSDGRCEKANRQRPGSPFSFPRQKRSVRPRLNLSINPDYLSIDSDSE